MVLNESLEAHTDQWANKLFKNDLESQLWSQMKELDDMFLEELLKNIA